MRSALCSMLLVLVGLAPAGAQAAGDFGGSPRPIAFDESRVSGDLSQLLSEYQSYAQAQASAAAVTGPRRVEVAQAATVLQVCTMPPPFVDAHGSVEAYCWLDRADQPIWGRASGGTLPYSWCWDFGDGSPQVCGVASTSGEANNIATTHQYTTLGQKTATLTITDAVGASASGSVRILVAVDDPGLRVRTNAAIEDGLRWLYLNQQSDGSWGYYVGYTGPALLAFHLRQHLRSNDPCSDVYQGTVSSAIDYLLSQAALTGVSLGVYPDVNADGLTIRFGSGGSSGYLHGLAMMGLSSSQAMDYVAPVGAAQGMSLSVILQNAAEQCYRAQSKSGFYRGGWRYDINRTDGDADNSVSQWPILGLLAAREEAGLTIAPQCLSELRYWTDASQCADGGFGYAYPNQWCNIGKTGAGILAQALLGDHTEDPRVQAALNFIGGRWNGGSDVFGVPEHMNGNLYATYAVAKALRTIQDANGVAPEFLSGRDWYCEYRNYLVNHPLLGTPCSSTLPAAPYRQRADGSWVDSYWLGGGPIATAFALLVLIPSVVEPKPVAVANVTPNPISCPDTPVHFDGTSSSHQNPLRHIVEWCWDFDESDGVDWNNPDTCGAVVDYCCYALPAGSSIKYAHLRVTDDTPVAEGGPLVNTVRIPIHLNNQNNPPVACLRPGCATQPPYSGRVGEPICFDGSASFDPDVCRGDSVACYRWDLDGDGEYDDGTGPSICFTWHVEYEGQVGLQVCDAWGEVSTNRIYVKVVASRKNLKVTSAQISMVPPCGYPCELPALTIHADVHLETELGGQTTLTPTTVEFWDGDPLAGGVFIGAQPISGGTYGPQVFALDQPWTVTNPNSQHTFFVLVDPADQVPEWNEETDNIASLLQPTRINCDSARAVPAVLWPPNHKLKPITIAGVTAASGVSVTITVTGITQDEPLNTRGDGGTCPDAQIAEGQALVRAERTGTPGIPGNGRVYVISFVASDGSGQCTGSVTVCVPHDDTELTCFNDGQRYDSVAPCDGRDILTPEITQVDLRVGPVTGSVASIEYDLPAVGEVSLAVLDVSGRLMVAVEKATRPAGRHQVSFDTSKLPAGIYFCRLQVGRLSLSRSLALLK